jgi:hypothetical protein
MFQITGFAANRCQWQFAQEATSHSLRREKRSGQKFAPFLLLNRNGIILSIDANLEVANRLLFATITNTCWDA